MDNIFDLPVEDVVTIDENIDYVDQLVGEGKKFKDVQSLARGKAESDAYIERLRREIEDAKKELNTRMSLEKFLEAQKAGTPAAQVETPTPGSQDQTMLDEATLLSKLEEVLARREAQKAQETNLQKVSRIMSEQFGDKVGVVVNNKAAELGMSKEQLQSLATSSPEAFFRLVGVDSSAVRQPVTPVVPRTQVNSSGAPSNEGVRNAKYYERMKQTDPKKYFSDATTSQMIRDRAALGQAFYS